MLLDSKKTSYCLCCKNFVTTNVLVSERCLEADRILKDVQNGLVHVAACMRCIVLFIKLLVWSEKSSLCEHDVGLTNLLILTLWLLMSRPMSLWWIHNCLTCSSSLINCINRQWKNLRLKQSTSYKRVMKFDDTHLNIPSIQQAWKLHDRFHRVTWPYHLPTKFRYVNVNEAHKRNRWHGTSMWS